MNVEPKKSMILLRCKESVLSLQAAKNVRRHLQDTTGVNDAQLHPETLRTQFTYEANRA